LRILAVVVGIVAALALGLGSAGVLGYQKLTQAAVANGPWQVLLSAGNQDAGVYERTAVALGGLFALSRTETLYYSAMTDSSGLRLSDGCRYQVVGSDPDTRWWSLTAYAMDNFLIRNGDDHHALAQTTVEREADGSFVIHVAPTAQPKNWISNKDGGNFILMLRLYNPGQSVYEAPGTAPLPEIVRGECS